jgi:hypothetical protein
MQVLHKQYTDIAWTFMDQFVAKKNTERLDLYNTVAAEITAHSTKTGLVLPSSLPKVHSVLPLPLLLMISLQKLENWFNNHRPRDETKKKTKKRDKSALVNWKLRNVVQQTKRDVIKERMAMKAPGVTQEDNTWILTYQEACTEVIAGLTPAETRECERMAKEWNATGPDPVTQAM